MLEPRAQVRRIGILDHTVPIASSKAVTARTLGPQTRFVLRLAAADAARIAQVAGLTLAGPINRANEYQRRTAARLGPDEWLLLAPEGEATALRDATAAALAGCHHTLVDISHRNAAIEITGRAAPDVINAGCPLDLGLDRFKPGDATRTLFGKVEIVLIRLDDAGGVPVYRLEFWRSFGRFVHGFIVEVAREFA